MYLAPGEELPPVAALYRVHLLVYFQQRGTQTIVVILKYKQ